MEGIIKAEGMDTACYRKSAARMLEITDLEKVLENAPAEIEYRQGSNGFSLVNN